MLVYSFLTTVIFCQTIADDIKGATKENIDFLEKIKQDLRRNNDDYKEMLQAQNKHSSLHSQTLPSKNTKAINKISNNKKSFRRNNDKLYEEYDYEETIKHITNSVTLRNNTISSIRIQKLSQSPIFQTPNRSRFDNHNKVILPILKTTSTGKYENIPKFVNKDKINKFKQFMKKNQGLLRNYVSNRLQTQTQQSTYSVFSTVGGYNKTQEPGHLRGKTKVKKMQDYNDGKLPSPDVLDMAPAKGSKIHKLRIRGRLCHRHVLIPEGPKYDSRGRWYLPAHTLVARRPYNVTKRPRLLLPRCCNCCKKSVLGCE